MLYCQGKFLGFTVEALFAHVMATEKQWVWLRGLGLLHATYIGTCGAFDV